MADVVEQRGQHLRARGFRLHGQRRGWQRMFELRYGLADVSARALAPQRPKGECSSLSAIAEHVSVIPRFGRWRSAHDELSRPRCVRGRRLHRHTVLTTAAPHTQPIGRAA